MVIDASVAIPWLIETPFSTAANKIRPDEPVAPTILMVETASALMKYRRAFDLPLSQVHQSISHLELLIADLVDDRDLLSSAIRLADSYRHKVYDCLYLALALDRNLPLATADKRLASLATSLGVECHLIEPRLP